MTPGYTVHRKRLGGALPAVVAQMRQANTATVAWAVRVGSRDEPPRLAGISHFVEHLKFRGTERFPSEAELQAHLDALGALFNGSTGRENTIFWLEVQPHRLNEAIAALAEMARPSTFSGIEVERRVILHEIANSQDTDGVPYDMHNLALAGLFPNHPVGNVSAGSAETVGATTIDDVKAHIARHYTAENSVVVVAGPVDPDDTFAQLEQAFAHLPRGPVPKRRPLPAPLPAQLATVRWRSARTEALLAFTLGVRDLRETLIAEQLAAVLGPSSRGRLSRSIRTKAGLAYASEAGFTSFSDLVLLTIGVDVAQGQLPRAMGEILPHLVALRDRGPTPSELAVARGVFETEIASSFHAPTRLASWLAETTLEAREVEGEGYDALSQSITPDEIQRFAQRLFAPGNGHLVTRGLPSPGTEYTVAWGMWVKALGRP